MATFIPHASLAKLLGSRVIETTATTVRDLMSEVESRVPPDEWKQMQHAAILVNGVSIHQLKGLDTALDTKDKIWMVLPTGGG